MRRAPIATIAKALVLLSLPLVLAWAGWVYGTAWHPGFARVPCRHPASGPPIIGGTCYTWPLWTRPEALEAFGAGVGLVVVTLLLVLLRTSNAKTRGQIRSPMGAQIKS